MNKTGLEIVFAFDSLLNSYPDQVEFSTLFSSFMVSALHFTLENVDIPLLEMVTVLREHKPNITEAINNHDHQGLHQIMQMDMSLEVAEITLKSILENTYSISS